MIDQVNATGYGLTMGAHTNFGKANRIFKKANVGNFYTQSRYCWSSCWCTTIWRTWSKWYWTKSGGPNYLKSFLNEKTFTDNVMATGGNIDLLNKNNQ